MVLKNSDKRGMFFTVIALILIAFFLISYTVYSVVQDREPINKRVDSMNNFIFSLEQDMSRQIYISGYRALVALDSHVTTKGSFLSNSREALKEAILNGTLNSQPINLMEGYRLEDWAPRVQSLSNSVNLFASYSIKNISVSQDDPWSVKIEVIIDMNLSDKSNLASWNKTQKISSRIEITGFEDPLYLMNTNGKITNRINKTAYLPFVQGSDISNLTLHVQSSNYIPSPLAPSFLDRLEGKTIGNEQGIESLVYIPELSAQGIDVEDKSAVDYIYFSSSNPDSKRIQGMPFWFKLDEPHLSVYNASHLAV